MARRRTPPESVRAKWLLADRLRTIRTELFGDRGLAEFARRLGVPLRTWYSYESGVTVPAEILLSFIELTAVEPHWLMHGAGPRYTAQSSGEVAGSEVSASLGHPLSQTAVGGESAPSLVHAFLTPSRSPSADSTNRGFQTLRVEGNAMEPIIADGAFVAFAAAQEPPDDLEGKLIVAGFDNRLIVRWFHVSGNFGLLRAENPDYQPATELFDLVRQSDDLPMRRVLWVGTQH